MILSKKIYKKFRSNFDGQKFEINSPEKNKASSDNLDKQGDDNRKRQVDRLIEIQEIIISSMTF